jgi:hypothetical protein
MDIVSDSAVDFSVVFLVTEIVFRISFEYDTAQYMIIRVSYILNRALIRSVASLRVNLFEIDHHHPVRERDGLFT